MIRSTPASYLTVALGVLLGLALVLIPLGLLAALPPAIRAMRVSPLRYLL